MTNDRQEPLRGDAAWRASLKEIAARNDAACAAGARRRAEREAVAAREIAQQERREAAGLRKRQPR
jgi:hypothetical protein